MEFRLGLRDCRYCGAPLPSVLQSFLPPSRSGTSKKQRGLTPKARRRNAEAAALNRQGQAIRSSGQVARRSLRHPDRVAGRLVKRGSGFVLQSPELGDVPVSVVAPLPAGNLVDMTLSWRVRSVKEVRYAEPTRCKELDRLIEQERLNRENAGRRRDSGMPMPAVGTTALESDADLVRQLARIDELQGVTDVAAMTELAAGWRLPAPALRTVIEEAMSVVGFESYLSLVQSHSSWEPRIAQRLQALIAARPKGKRLEADAAIYDHFTQQWLMDT
jgi:hypothetical protein